MNKTIIIIAGIAIVLIGAGIYQSQQNKSIPVNNQAPAAPQNQNSETRPRENSGAATSPDGVLTFEQCVSAGYPVTGEKPRRACTVSDDLVYFEILACAAPNGESMNIYDAQQLFDASPCSLEGSAKENPVCNETTGTWWIDIQTYRKDCNPACVINVATKTAEVNWRCTGAQP